MNVLTKSALVLRDLDVFAGRAARIGTTVTTLDDRLQRLWEPQASPVDERFRIIEEARRAGLATSFMFGPLLPWLSDDAASIEAMLRRAGALGIERIWIDALNPLPFGISILAGLQTIPVDLHESATIDGAGTWGRFRYVTLPSLLPVIFIVTTFSIVITFFDFQLVYVLTGGGPANSTHLMATYAYSLSMGAGQMGLGSAVALSMVPVLGLLLVLLTLYVRKD